MELKYLVARYSGKRILFVILAAEEAKVQERLAETSCSIFFSGEWQEGELSQKKFERWFAKVDRWIVTSALVDSDVLTSMVCDAHVSGKRVEDLEAFFLEVDPMVPANCQQLIHFLTTKGVPKDKGVRLYSAIRYAIEPLVALVIILLLSPILLMVAIAVKLSSPGTILYSQERVGYRGKIFNIYKFRSMTQNAEGGVATWAQATKTDSKLTPIGGFLRSAHLDELPQLWNIVRGEVSFIGPRPERPEFVKELTERFPLFKLRPLVKPGITGWAQTQQGYANSYSDSLRKLELDLFYIIKFSPLLDIKIALKTIAIVFMGGTEGLKRARAQASIRTLHR
jgi:lipopolysaccharide/colanic/teichoic acid biosynthesis glycosyltransferase